jgi:hypothetical protein
MYVWWLNAVAKQADSHQWRGSGFPELGARS